jgi:hypothetical protein
MIKPDGVQRGLVGKIIQRFEDKGFKLVAMKMVWVRVPSPNQPLIFYVLPHDTWRILFNLIQASHFSIFLLHCFKQIATFVYTVSWNIRIEHTHRTYAYLIFLHYHLSLHSLRSSRCQKQCISRIRIINTFYSLLFLIVLNF